MVEYDIKYDYKFKKIFKKLDNSYKVKVKKQIVKIIDDPYKGKPMRNVRKGTREVYVPPFRLSYQVFFTKEGDVEICHLNFLDLYHKDKQ